MKRFFICILALLMIAGCAQQPGEVVSTTEEITEAPEVRVDISKDYVLIVAGSGLSYDIAYRFSKLYAAATGITLKMKKDTLTEKTESAKEIVFGKTDRDEYYPIDHSALVADAFLIALKGERIYPQRARRGCIPDCA